MNLQAIQELTLDKCFGTVLSRVIDLSIVPQGQPLYTLHLDESKSFYDRVILNAVLVKPSLQDLEAELAEYKTELTVAENARLAEIARVEDIMSRFSAIQDIRGVAASINVDCPNPPSLLKEIIQNNSQQLLASLEAAATAFSIKVQREKDIEQVRKVGAIAVKACNHVIEVIAGYNITRLLTPAQKDSMLVQFAPVLQALQQFRPGVAKSLIEAITPDETLVTSDMKSDILEVFGAYEV